MSALRFDMRIWNPYTVEDLQSSHPALFQRLEDWFIALKRYDETSLAKILTAKSAEALAAAAAKKEQALIECCLMGAWLGPVIKELEVALAADPAQPIKQQLADLLESARINQQTFKVDAAAAVEEALKKGAPITEKLIAAAQDALAKCTRQMEELAARSGDTTKSFTALRPHIAELQQLWNTVEKALKPLERKDENAVRAPFDSRLRAASTTICNQLHAALCRDRKSGQLPPPAIEEQSEGDMAGSIAAHFASAMARQDFAEAASHLAPWLREKWSAEKLRQAIDDDVRQTMEFYEEVEEPPLPGGYYVGTNPLGYEDFAEDGHEDLPKEVTAANFVAWCPVEIHTTQEDSYLTNWDTYCSLYLIVVKAGDSEKIGYLRIGEEDF